MTIEYRDEGGFPKLAFMEDYAMVQKLRKKYGRARLLRSNDFWLTGLGREDKRINVSGRRWVKVGVMRTFLINQYIIWSYHAGVPDSKLYDMYYKTSIRQKKVM